MFISHGYNAYFAIKNYYDNMEKYKYNVKDSELFAELVDCQLLELTKNAMDNEETVTPEVTEEVVETTEETTPEVETPTTDETE